MPEPEPPVIFPGQTLIDVDEDGETVIRETLIPPPAKKEPEQACLLFAV
jgi:hypothetical protein